MNAPKKLGRPRATVKKETIHISLSPDDAAYLRAEFPNVSDGVRQLIAIRVAITRAPIGSTGTPSKAH